MGISSIYRSRSLIHQGKGKIWSASQVTSYILCMVKHLRGSLGPEKVTHLALSVIPLLSCNSLFLCVFTRHRSIILSFFLNTLGRCSLYSQFQYPFSVGSFPLVKYKILWVVSGLWDPTFPDFQWLCACKGIKVSIHANFKLKPWSLSLKKQGIEKSENLESPENSLKSAFLAFEVWNNLYCCKIIVRQTFKSQA